MKAANAILLTMVLQGSVALSQITPTEKAAASGTFSTAHVGDNNVYNINCSGIGVDQGKKIVEILNRVLANQDPTAVNAKLDELLVVASQPAQTQALQAPPNILGLTVTPLAPRPNIGADGLIEGPMGVNPGVTVTFTVDSMFTQAMFSVFCDRSCAATSASVEGTSSPKMLTTDKPNISVVALGLTLMPNNKVTITVRSIDARKISVQNVQGFVPPVR
jgi:hypothetical protein